MSRSQSTINEFGSLKTPTGCITSDVEVKIERDEEENISRKHERFKSSGHAKRKDKRILTERRHVEENESTERSRGKKQRVWKSEAPPVIIPKNSKKQFTLEDITAMICHDPPDTMNVRDEQLCTALLKGMDIGMLEDMCSYFLRGEGIRDDEKKSWGPPKWNYTKGDYFDSFDYYAATGCPNCGSAYELDQPYAYHLNPPTLVCLQCGHRACALHTNEESESIVDRLDTKSSNESEDPKLFETALTASSSISPSFSSSSSIPEGFPVYVRGTREHYDFGKAGKEWWQHRYLPKVIRLQELDRTIRMISMMSKFKAPTIKELCEICGNDEAFYTTYQARSADEGMTIMYECTRCHHRKIFNN